MMATRDSGARKAKRGAATQTRARWAHIEKLFESAQQLVGAARVRFLDEACAGDEVLRDDVESLLASAERNVDFLETPVPGTRPDLQKAFAGARDGLVGTRLGPYRLTRRIASGGMGSVYLAMRDDREYDAHVAIKVVKRGMDTDEVLRRFELERQVLASLEHPSIARVLDAGSTPDGRPYYVMPFVDGRAVTDACDAARSTIEERLRLFVKICAAVDYAHRNLVLHRDLKPSNILVGTSGTPILLDFGIAKLLAPDEPDLTSLHPPANGARRMTPQYTSPEHASGGRTTTASDVYSLGVVLYELVTGCLPYETEATEASTSRDRILQATPARPSTLDIGAELARRRRTSVRRLRKRLGGDLEKILLCALRKEPERRYQSAASLADDIERMLASKPVRARGDSWLYRTRMFVTRHRVGVAAALLSVSALAFALVSTMRSERKARLEARNADHVARLLVEIFSAIDPEIDAPLTLGRGQQITALELLDLGTERIRKSLKDLPWIRSRLLHAFGQIYLNLGAVRQAIPPLQEAVALREDFGGVDDVDVAATKVFLASARIRLGKVESGIELLRASLRVLDPVLKGGDPLLEYARNNYAHALRMQGEHDEAQRIFKRVLEGRRARFGPKHASVGEATNNLALVAWGRKELVTAQRLFEEALEIKRASIPGDHPSLALTMHNLGYLALKDRGDPETALPYLLEAQRIRKLRYPAFHPALAASAQMVAQVYMALGRSPEAEAPLREAIEIYRKQAGDKSWFVAEARTALGECLMRCDRMEEAERELVPSAEAVLRALPLEHQHSQEVLVRLIAFYEKAGDEQKAAACRAKRRDVAH